MDTKRGGYLLKACHRCGGDAYLDLTDGPEWRCIQCGRLVVSAAIPAATLIARQEPRAA